MPTTKLRRVGHHRKRYRQAEWSKVNFILWILIAAVTLFIVTIVLPGMIVNRIEQPVSIHTGVNAPVNPSVENPNETTSVMKQGLMVPVYLSKLDKIETVPLEDYVRGVIAAEMPAEFELEALKAQALAARTYIYRRLLDKDTSNVPVEGALVTDTTAHQVYLTKEALAKKWTGDDYTKYWAKITQAVEDTRNLILTYQGKPINATFFSTSNGKTENAEEIWPFAVPYLRSVPSPWDKQAPKYQDTISLSLEDVVHKLGVKSISTAKNGIRVLERTSGGSIKEIEIGGSTFTGTEVREKLGLRSASFEWKWKGTGKNTKLEITTYGYGHGVGLSQWGANVMAKEGKTAAEIVRYYYQGIAISEASNIVN
ncbi:stage II sporulation protein D [Paenibacillus albiflavus]|uniref:Stage II sporulation protein D n=1 Tax=Paenibacillus albiflavus TaxID=2545760 RepID=A0A4R4EFD9_9BACL|nr:stage II sporulation protein D [Paenibacillus albiflavus]TCZ76808.1 stage II sporulation protein D [Paenibacillus albiflavus]